MKYLAILQKAIYILTNSVSFYNLFSNSASLCIFSPFWCKSEHLFRMPSFFILVINTKNPP